LMQDCIQGIGRALTQTGRMVTEAAPHVGEGSFASHFPLPPGATSPNGGNGGSLEEDVAEIATGDAAGHNTHRSFVHENLISVTIPGKFHSVSQMKRFWFGEGEYVCMPIAGGIMEMNRKFGTKWRKGLSNTQLKRYSKVKIIMESLERMSVVGGNQLEAALLQFDDWWKNSCNGQLHPMVEFLKQKGMYDAKTRK
jgi:Transcriptional activator of glycolytic enzymes